MATLSNMVSLIIHRNVIHRFMVQALQDPQLCSSTVLLQVDAPGGKSAGAGVGAGAVSDTG
jgi:hypothetical protein